MSLRHDLSDLADRLQGDLFPFLQETVGPLTDRMQRFVMVLEMVRVASFLPAAARAPGRPPADRAALARAFISGFMRP